MPTLIEAAGVVKRFGKVAALDGLDCNLPTGEITAVLGPNGAGKTTLIRAIATLVRPDAGHLRVLGHDVTRHPGRVRQLIGLAGQSAAVEATLTGRENLVMVGRLYGLSRRAARQAAVDVLGRLGLDDAADRPVKGYSGGMRRRLDLGASLVGDPRVLLLDEPTTGLDPGARIELWDAVRDLGAAGTEVLLSTQYLEEADQLAGRIVIIDHGVVIAEGTPSQLKTRAGSDRIEVHTRDDEDLADAAHVLSGAVGAAATVEHATRRASVAVADGAGRLGSVMAGLTGAGVTVEDLTLRRPTLDEVFVALTGKSSATTSTPEMEGVLR